MIQKKPFLTLLICTSFFIIRPNYVFASGHGLEGIGDLMVSILSLQSLVVTTSLLFFLCRQNEASLLSKIFMVINIVAFAIGLLLCVFLPPFVILLPEFIIFYIIYFIDKGKRIKETTKIVWVTILLSLFYIFISILLFNFEKQYLATAMIIASCYLLVLSLLNKTNQLYRDKGGIWAIVFFVMEIVMFCWNLKCSFWEDHQFLAALIFLSVLIVLFFLMVYQLFGSYIFKTHLLSIVLSSAISFLLLIAIGIITENDNPLILVIVIPCFNLIVGLFTFNYFRKGQVAK